LTFQSHTDIIIWSFLAVWVAAASFEPLFAAFNPDNPFYTWEQVKQLGIYGWFVLPTGAIAGIDLITIMLVSALAVIRRRNYNTFYYIHVFFALLVMVVLCLHASTNFYFILPGLLLWLYNWILRMQNVLFYKPTIQVESAGGDWYRMRLPNAPDKASIDVSTAEKGLTPTKNSELQHPLETHYIRLSAISKVQIVHSQQL
jgi:ferric-chelate reductase